MPEPSMQAYSMPNAPLPGILVLVGAPGLSACCAPPAGNGSGVALHIWQALCCLLHVPGQPHLPSPSVTCYHGSSLAVAPWIASVLGLHLVGLPISC